MNNEREQGGELQPAIATITITCSFCRHRFNEQCPIDQLELGYYKDAITNCPECKGINFVAAYLGDDIQDGPDVSAFGPFQNTWAIYEEAWIQERLRRSPPVIVNMEAFHTPKVSKCEYLGINYIVLTLKSFSITDTDEDGIGEDLIFRAVIYGQGPQHSANSKSDTAVFVRIYTEAGFEHFKTHGPTPIKLHKRAVTRKTKVPDNEQQ